MEMTGAGRISKELWSTWRVSEVTSQHRWALPSSDPVYHGAGNDRPYPSRHSVGLFPSSVTAIIKGRFKFLFGKFIHFSIVKLKRCWHCVYEREREKMRDSERERQRGRGGGGGEGRGGGGGKRVGERWGCKCHDLTVEVKRSEDNLSFGFLLLFCGFQRSK